MTPIRAAVWGTGRTGIEIVRAGIRRPWLTFVAAGVTSAKKDGLDLGLLAGLPEALHAPATADIAALLRRDDVDVVIYSGLGDEAEVGRVVRRIVDAGKNAVTVTGLIHPPTTLGEAGARALDEACIAKGVRAIGAGINPGFLLDVLPVAWLSTEASFTRLTARRVTDATNYDDALFAEMGIGRPPGAVDLSGSRLAVDQSLRVIGDSIGMVFEEVLLTHEPIVSSTRRESRGLLVEPGMATGALHRAAGIVDGKPRIEVEWATVFMLDTAVDGMEAGVTIEVEGVPAMRMQLTSSLVTDAYAATAARALAVVPGLLAMPPGLYTSAQVPLGVRM